MTLSKCQTLFCTNWSQHIYSDDLCALVFLLRVFISALSSCPWVPARLAILRTPQWAPPLESTFPLELCTRQSLFPCGWLMVWALLVVWKSPGHVLFWHVAAWIPRECPTEFRYRLHPRVLEPHIHGGLKPCEFPMLCLMLPVHLVVINTRWVFLKRNITSPPSFLFENKPGCIWKDVVVMVISSPTWEDIWGDVDMEEEWSPEKTLLFHGCPILEAPLQAVPGAVHREGVDTSVSPG